MGGRCDTALRGILVSSVFHDTAINFNDKCVLTLLLQATVNDVQKVKD